MTNGNIVYSGEVCVADPDPLMCIEPPDGFVCSIPAQTPEEAADFLEVIGSGGALGTGVRMSSLGVRMPQIREAYEEAVRNLVIEVERRRRAGQPAAEIARFAVAERRRIANRMRWRSGVGTRVLFEVRDWAEYGPGGRSYRNIEQRYIRRGVRAADLHGRMIAGATHPNTGISNTAIRGARYLRHGGRVIVVLSVATTAYVLLTAPQDQLERLIYEEAGGFFGGSMGAAAGVGFCLVFGIATGGWGLLACGVVGGIAGGAGGSWVGNRIYYTANPELETAVDETGILDPAELMCEMPALMCVAPLTR